MSELGKLASRDCQNWVNVRLGVVGVGEACVLWLSELGKIVPWWVGWGAVGVV